MYNPYLIEDIRKMERKEVNQRNYSLEEINKDIKKYSRRAYSLAFLATISMLSAIGGCIYFNKDNLKLSACSMIMGSCIAGISLGAGKVFAIKSDTRKSFKKNLEGSID